MVSKTECVCHGLSEKQWWQEKWRGVNGSEVCFVGRGGAGRGKQSRVQVFAAG